MGDASPPSGPDCVGKAGTRSVTLAAHIWLAFAVAPRRGVRPRHRLHRSPLAAGQEPDRALQANAPRPARQRAPPQGSDDPRCRECVPACLPRRPQPPLRPGPPPTPSPPGGRCPGISPGCSSVPTCGAWPATTPWPSARAGSPAPHLCRPRRRTARVSRWPSPRLRRRRVPRHPARPARRLRLPAPVLAPTRSAARAAPHASRRRLAAVRAGPNPPRGHRIPAARAVAPVAPRVPLRHPAPGMTFSLDSDRRRAVSAARA